MSPNSSWKDKYLKECETSEAREANWDAEKNLLQRMLVRTSLASEGQSAGLDNLLMRLREEVRKGGFDTGTWQDLQDHIDRKVSALDELKSESEQQLRTTLQALVTELRGQTAFHIVKDRLKELEKRLRKPDTLSQSCNAWLNDFAGILQTGLNGVSGQQSPSQKGFFGKLFIKPEDEGHREQPQVAVDEQDVNQRMQIARRVGDLLGQLLEQVALEPASEVRARRLQERLLASDDWDELRDGLNGVAELVVAAVTRSQREFEAFLRRLDERLDTLKKYFSEQEYAVAGRRDASAELDLEIQQELEAFGQRVDTSTDFPALKASVSGHLLSIREAVGRFRTKESEREKYLSEQLDTMQEKMAAMEAQADHVKAELREQRHRATTDVLTQLPNREAWQERLNIEYQRWRRYGNPLTLAMLDIDFFKRVNDSYGHKAGDRVLQLMAKALRDRLRQTDFVARFGGEEFVLLFPETSTEAARDVLDGLRAHIKALPFHFRGEPVSVTFSAGVADFQSGDGIDEVFDLADRSLYKAKKAGRDQVCIVTRPDQ